MLLRFLIVFPFFLVAQSPDLRYFLQGRNSVLYVDENERILRSIRSQIQMDTPCAFITRPSNAGEDQGPSQLFDATGFDVLGQAFVPQRDFLLPKAKKKRKKSKA